MFSPISQNAKYLIFSAFLVTLEQQLWSGFLHVTQGRELIHELVSISVCNPYYTM
jgi:hypothetical protein